jgi:hypothetical protein
MATDRRDPTPSRARERHAGGRPTKYTPALGAQLCKLVSLGVAMNAACKAEGIGRKTLYRWREYGAQGREPYRTFVRQLNRSLAKAETAITLHVVRAAQRDWRAGAWWLERRAPDRYGPKQTLRVEKPLTELTEAELDAAIAQHGYTRSSSNGEAV